jgi:diguanylate cyclase (GGDEF)-like protein
MSNPDRSKARKAFSAQGYLLVLLLAIIVLFSVIANTVIHRVSEVREVSAAETRNAATAEVQRAIEKVLQSTDELAADLAGWGEIHQQLLNPQYYNYWREQRLVSARNYPDYVRGIELYDAEGSALAEIIGSGLPRQRGNADRYVERMGNKLFLVSFAPVQSNGGADKTIGYVGTMWELLPAMLLLQHFSFVDVETLAVLPGPDIRWPADRIAGLINYQPHQNPAAASLEQVVLNALMEFAIILGVLLILVYAGVSRLLIRPLQTMVRHLAGSNSQDNIKDIGTQLYLTNSRLLEINTLSEALRRYHHQLAATSRDLDETNRELWTLAHIDALTGAHNRRAFDRDWRALLETTSEQRMHVAFLLFDCDFFKAINDTYGHTTGDRLVQALARLLQHALRKGDRLYRLGGDEFAAVLLNADQHQAHQVAERCLEKLRTEPFHNIGIQEPVRVSVGLAVTEASSMENLNQLPRQADLAMYHAKRDKHTKIAHYDPSMDKQAGSLISSRAVTAAVDAAHGQGGVEMHYQPILSAATGQVLHYEALVRIRDNQGLLYPGEIFPVIDQRGLQVPFDLSVVNSIVDDLRAKHLPRGTGVSINLSAHALVLPNLVEHLARVFPVLERHPIIIEVTETDLITQMQHVAENLASLRERGVLIALDDFGSGYSSIRYLASMPVDIVKFDIEMIRDLEAEPARRSVVENTARMVREAGYQLVAEGIETPELRDLATSMGATHLQGYLFGKPQRTPHPAVVSHAG